MLRRILYVQFTDPMGYPPIEHSTHLLADRGWDVLLLGTGTFPDQKFQFLPHDRIRVKKIRFVQGGFWQKLLYIYFFFWTLYWTLRWRPKWIYASDPLACPVVWLIQKIVAVRVIYHEHDSPDLDETPSRFMRLVYACRDKLGRDATLCVFPQDDRLDQFVQTTKRTRPTVCVWNCPRLSEIPSIAPGEHNGLILYYHGSITSSRLPRSLIVAASRFKGVVQLRIAGFEVVGAIGYLQELIKLAEECGAPGLIEPLGTISLRRSLLHTASMADVGLSLMPNTAEDVNLRHMVGPPIRHLTTWHAGCHC